MDNPDSNQPQKFLLSLREFRPELAEFLANCERHTHSSARHDFTLRRVRLIAEEGRKHGYLKLADTAEVFLAYASSQSDPALLAECMRSILVTALHALTFTDDAPLSIPKIVFPGAPKKPKLVVADDDRIVREMMKQLFSGASELQVATDGQEAYGMVLSGRPDLIILDDFMPGMTGLKLIETLHASPDFSDIPVIMLTASDRERDRDRALEAGAVDYITKPFNPGILLDRVQEVLARK